jgi:hypothetical protein
MKTKPDARQPFVDRENQRKRLAKAMDRANGKRTKDQLCNITFRAASGHRAYLSGTVYMITSFPSNAYAVGRRQAADWITRYPLYLVDGEIHPC